MKGISVRNNKKGVSYEAYVMIKNSGKRSKTRFKAHVGTYKTIEEAITARKQFIRDLI